MLSKLSYINLVIREVFPTRQKKKKEKNYFQAAVEKNNHCSGSGTLVGLIIRRKLPTSGCFPATPSCETTS